MDLDLYMYVTYMCGKYIIQEICQLLCILEFDSRATLDFCIFLLTDRQNPELHKVLSWVWLDPFLLVNAPKRLWNLLISETEILSTRSVKFSSE